MMEWTQFLSMLGVTVLSSGGISGIIISLWRKQIDQRYAKELEVFKAQYQRFLDENNIRFARWYNDQAQAITELYSNLSLLYLSLQRLTQKLHDVPTDEEEKRKYFTSLLTNIQNAYKKSQHCWYKNQIYIPAQNEKIKELLYQSRATVTYYEGALEYFSIGDYQEAENACARFGDVLTSLQTELHDILTGKNKQP